MLGIEAGSSGRAISSAPTYLKKYLLFLIYAFMCVFVPVSEKASAFLEPLLELGFQVVGCELPDMGTGVRLKFRITKKETTTIKVSFLSWDIVFPCSPHCPGMHYVDQTGPRLAEIHLRLPHKCWLERPAPPRLPSTEVTWRSTTLFLIKRVCSEEWAHLDRTWTWFLF